MNTGDDLVTAGLSGLAALLGAWIGARATRRASVEAFDRAAGREDEAWQKALHQECLLNINLDKEQPPDDLWSFDTGVLRDCPAHAAAFSEMVLQRIIWARTANEKLEVALAYLREYPAHLSEAASRESTVLQLRRQVSGEISEIEKQLRR